MNYINPSEVNLLLNSFDRHYWEKDSTVIKKASVKFVSMRPHFPKPRVGQVLKWQAKGGPEERKGQSCRGVDNGGFG